MLKVNNFLDDIHLKNTESRRKVERLVTLLKEWIVYEEFYAKGMERILDKLLKKNDNVHEPLQKFYQLIETLSENINSFIDKVKKEIIIPTEEFLKSQNSQIKKIYIDGKKIGGFMIEIHENTTNSIEIYYESIQKCEKITVELDNEKSSKKKEKILSRLIHEQKDLKQKLRAYNKLNTGYIENSKKYEENIEKIIDAYNYHEKTIKEYYENTLKTLQEACINRYSVIEWIHLPIYENNVEFIEYSKEPFKLPEIVLENYIGSHPLFFHQKEPLTKDFSFIQQSGLEGLNRYIDDFYKNEIKEIVNKAWLGEELSSDDYLKAKSIIKSSKGRSILMFCLNIKRNAGHFLLTDIGFKHIGAVLYSAINECEKSQDLKSAKSAIILSQTFFKRNQDKSKVFLQEFIVNHRLWQSFEFWEDAINETLLEELEKQKNENTEDDFDTKALNCKNMIFYQLVSFGNIMMSFKISLENVFQFFKKYTEKYKFAKYESDELINAINDSIIINEE